MDVLHNPAALLRLNAEIGPTIGCNFDPSHMWWQGIDQLDQRAWEFRTVGYGHGELFWREFVSVLRAIGYDDVVSIEHEDRYMEPFEGLEKAVELLERVTLNKPAVSSWD